MYSTMLLARFVSSSRAARVARGGGSVVPASASTPKLLAKAPTKLSKESKVGDDSAVSPVKIYRGSNDSCVFFHAHTRGTVRFFTGIRNIPRDEALKHMPRLKKAGSKEAINILKDIERDGFIPDVFHYSAAISKCAKDGKLDEAKKIFRQMNQNKVAPNEVTMSSLIDACARNGNDEEAIRYLREMEENYELWPSAHCYSAAISACEKAGNWQKAIELLREAGQRGIPPDVVIYAATISACEKGGQTKKALSLLVDMEDNGIEANEVAFSAAISACEKGGAEYTAQALALFDEMCNRGVWPTVITYSAIISACEKGGADYTDTALQLFDEMIVYDIAPDVVVYSAVISACEKGGSDYTQTALDLFDELQEKKITPDQIIYNALISACGKGGDKYVDVALRCFNDMKRLGIDSDESTYTAITKTCYDNKRYPEALEKAKEAITGGFLPPLKTDEKEWDLHNMTEAPACMLLADALITFVHAASFMEIQVITGKGKNSPEGPVLQAKVPAFLRDVAGLELTEHINERGEVNEGRFVITKKALKKWAESDDFNRFWALMTGKE